MGRDNCSYLINYLTQPFKVWLGGGEGSFFLYNNLTQPFRVWLGCGEGWFFLSNYLTQPFRVWLGVWWWGGWWWWGIPKRCMRRSPKRCRCTRRIPKREPYPINDWFTQIMKCHNLGTHNLWSPTTATTGSDSFMNTGESAHQPSFHPWLADSLTIQPTLLPDPWGIVVKIQILNDKNVWHNFVFVFTTYTTSYSNLGHTGTPQKLPWKMAIGIVEFPFNRLIFHDFPLCKRKNQRVDMAVCQNLVPLASK